MISSLGKNPDRAKVIDFSDAYAPFFNGVFGPGDAKVVKAADLSGKVLGVTRGSVEDLELTKIAPADLTIKRLKTTTAPSRPTSPARCSSSRPAMWWPLQSTT